MPETQFTYENIERLIRLLLDKDVKLTWWDDDRTKEIVRFKALRHSDKAQLMALAGWPQGRPYKTDPLPKRISLAYADFLFNVPPIFTPAEEADREAQKALLLESAFARKLRSAADICVSEREVWWRIYTDPVQSPWPIIDWHSRSDVIPFMAGSRVLAVGFQNIYYGVKEDDPKYRHIEFHEDGLVINKLFRSDARSDELGLEVPLTDHPVTANIQEEWKHDLPMLAGRITNDEDARSVYDGLEDLFLDLNEAHTIDAENFRLAGKKRAIMDRKYQDQSGDANPGEEIFWVEGDFSELEGDVGPFKILEYTYDGESSIARKDDLTNTIITRAGLARQLVDSSSNGEGLAITGTALRTRLLPTIASVEGMAIVWVSKLPKVLVLFQQVDALPEGQFGGGHQWKSPEMAPSVALSSPLPIDHTEEATRHQTLISAELESIETAVEELRPQWSRERRELEVKRILANRKGYSLDDDGKPIILEGPQLVNPPTGGGVMPPVAQRNQGAGVGPGGATAPPANGAVEQPVT